MNDATKAPDWAAPPSAGGAVAAPADDPAVKAQKEQEAAAKKLEREQKKAAKDAEKAAAAEAKEAAKAAQKEQAKQPEQNGIRRPKPDGECGKAWALFDQLSASKGAPVAAAEIRAALPQHSHLNEGNVKAEYPRWKKFHGLSGTIAPTAPLAPTPQPQATA